MSVHRSLGMISRILDALDDFRLVVLAGIGELFDALVGRVRDSDKPCVSPD